MKGNELKNKYDNKFDEKNKKNLNFGSKKALNKKKNNNSNNNLIQTNKTLSIATSNSTSITNSTTYTTESSSGFSSNNKRKKELTPEQQLLKAKVVDLNKQIAKCANRKNLDGARELFNQVKETGFENQHSYSSILNVYIRCGDLKGAIEIFNDLKSSSRLKIDVVTCTTMLKGFGSIGDVTSSLKILNEMEISKPKVMPNIRTVNTFLRCCLMSGEINQAELLVSKLKEYNIKADISTSEYLITLLCQGLLIEKALAHVGRVKIDNDETNAFAVATMKLCIARACGATGDWKGCRKALKGITSALEEEEKIQTSSWFSTDAIDGTTSGHRDDDNNEINNEEDNNSDDEEIPYKKIRSVTGGKKSWKGSGEDESRLESLRIYRQHKRSELKKEMKSLEQFLEHFSKINTGKGAIHEWCKAMLARYGRMFSFPINYEINTDNDAISTNNNNDSNNINAAAAATNSESILSREECIEEILGILRSRLGLGNLLKKIYPITSTASTTPTSSSNTDVKNNKINNKSKNKTDIYSKEQFLAELNRDGIKAWKDFENRINKSINTEGYLDFNVIFSANVVEKDENKNKKEKPIKMEICSGAGEWAIAQAKADTDKANWLTLEMRHDRVYQTFCHALLESNKTQSLSELGIPNLCILGGDALKVLPERIPPTSINYICVNHPEPPQQTGSSYLDHHSQGHHLLQEPFFKEAERILQTNGILTIMTDNLWYGKLLLRTISNPTGMINRIFKSNSIDPSFEAKETLGGFILFKGVPPNECGYATDASSYFDRLWTRNQNESRYFISIKKTVATNKKIVFDDD